jgi:hypothetical protein
MARIVTLAHPNAKTARLFVRARAASLRSLKTVGFGERRRAARSGSTDERRQSR